MVGSSGPVSSEDFEDRLRGELGVYAGRAEKQQSVDAGQMGGVDHIGGDGEIFIEKLGGSGFVGEDAADARGGDDDRLGPLCPKPFENGVEAQQVDLRFVDS